MENTNPNLSERKLLINGKWESATNGKTFATYNPATEEKLL